MCAFYLEGVLLLKSCAADFFFRINFAILLYSSKKQNASKIEFQNPNQTSTPRAYGEALKQSAWCLVAFVLVVAGDPLRSLACFSVQQGTAAPVPFAPVGCVMKFW